MRWIVVALLLVVVACGGGDDDGGDSDAESAMERYFEVAMRQQGGPAYDFIVPEQAALIDRDLFIGCLQDDVGGSGDVDAVESYTETIDVPEIGPTETWAVTVDLEFDGREVTVTRHLIERDGEFFIFFGEDDLATYESGECL